MSSPRGRLAAAALLICFGVMACSSHSLPTKGDASADAPAVVACTGSSAMNGTNGLACGCAGDCASGFCVDGVCCNSACTDTCKSCNTPGAPGICRFVPSGVAPRLPATCPISDVSSCGLDGTCDGAGACRSYAAGITCAPGTCDGAAVKDVRVCDGQGTCTSGPATICAPFGCDLKTNACVVTCTADADCVSGAKCVSGSCGPKPVGAVCTAGSQCASNFCADGFCCNVACTGACVSCDQGGRVGTCWPIAVNNPDPHGICSASAAATCGQTGSCDGIGGCAKYAAETICLAPFCSGDRLNTAGTCDGLGTCRPQGVQNCDPYQCTAGTCVNRCAVDADCVSGHSCVNGSCGPKSNGQTCAAAGDCASNFCVDGVCCADACQGACRSCALASSRGTCMPSPAAGFDPRGVCADQHATSCGTDGTCDGTGGCHKYLPGTACATEKCATGIYTPTATCDANGNCAAPDAIACAPFACNGARCFTACTVDGNCTAGKVCTGNSCGLKPNGAFCSTKTECQSTNCAQGVCCLTACAGACESCALAGTMGTCTATPTGLPDPAASCVDQGGKSCGTDGKCQAGACQKYPKGTACAGASCPAAGTTFTPAATCDGAGACATPASSSCFPFACGTAACKSTCSANADCAQPASCVAGSCGLKPPGAVCAGGTECGTGICAQGVCCSTACGSKCMSCALPASAGTCSPIPAGGTDPTGQCTAQGAATCGTTGFCNGAGACQLFPAGTQCAGPACPKGTTTATLARTCDGAGVCKPATTQTCAPFACNGTTCTAVCAVDGDCAPGNVCNAGACGKKRLGQICAAGADCDSGNCVDGVCCSSASCPTCVSCNVAGAAGACSAVPAAAMDPHARCTASPPCGFNGTCNGAGSCAFSPSGAACGANSCSAATQTPAGSCDGAGTCKQPTVSCSPYACGPSACLTMCSKDGDCAAGFTCQSGYCTNLSPNGAACAGNATCISGHCSDGFCCGSASCGTCSSCAIAGKEGTCTPVAAGAADPAAVCVAMAATSCGTTGTCNGAGACATYPAGTICAPASCDGMSGKLKAASTCTAMGMCMPGPMTACDPYVCDSATIACKTSCTVPADCAKMNTCILGDAGTGACSMGPMPMPMP